MANPRYANGHRRRELRKRVLASETHCGICGHPVDKTLPAGHDWAPEIDEIIPISRGGSPTQRTNVQLTHRVCNQRKSNRLPEEHTQRPTDAPLPTSRTW